MKSEVPLQNCFTTLQTEEERPVASGEMLKPSKVSWSAPRLTTSTTKKRQWVVIVGNSLLRGMEAPICQPDALPRVMCCLSGARHIRNVAKRLSSLIQSSCCSPLLLFHIVINNTVRSSLRSIKKDYRALGVGKGFWSIGCFFIDPPHQRKRLWKGQSNLANEQIFTGLLPQPGVWLFKTWE